MKKLINPLRYRGIDLHHIIMVEEQGKLVGFTLLRTEFASIDKVEAKARLLLRNLVKGYNVNQMINIIVDDEGDKFFQRPHWLGRGGNVTTTPDILHWGAVEIQARRELQALCLLSQVVFDYDLQDVLQDEFIRLQDKQFRIVPMG